MELTLNLVWLCVAIVGLKLLWGSLSRAEAHSDRSPDHWRKIVAMSCALVILFFVISMTDDLHDQEILVEESKSSRILSRMDVSSPAIPGPVVPLVFLLSLAIVCVVPALPAARRLIEPSEVLSLAAIDNDRLCGRAPPASLA
ncbi:MAG TPA: hypothetical protein VG051_04105 [Candidatus Acidoferrum sp.]|jgi:hypothetical protein|nr:hypothetical protein [Candidatus Acidoferrum sp.]